MKPIRINLLIMLLACFAWPTISLALEPPTQEQIERYKKDGSWEERVKDALAIGNHKMAPELVARTNYKLRRLSQLAEGKTPEEIDRALPAPPGAWQQMPSTGDVNMFVLLIEFNDYPRIAADTQAAMDARIFDSEDTGNADYPYESLAAYYDRSSYGLLNLQGTTFAWYNAGTRPIDPQVSNPEITKKELNEASDTIRQDLIKNAINYFDAAGHDFSQYDNDGDGDIDYFAVIWTGPHGEWATFWWGWRLGFTDSSYTVDGKRLGIYSWQEESDTYPNGDFIPTTLIHETGHALGLPDYYDYDGGETDREGPDGGVGGLDMMDGRSDHNAFSKFVLDWLDPTVISVAGSYPGQHLTPSSSTADALLIMPGASGSAFEKGVEK